jgi:transketolase
MDGDRKQQQQDIDTLRFLAVDMVQKADSGHPGLPLGAAPMAWVLWTRWLRHNPANPHWFGRDRFVLSAGHGSAMLYALLHLTGYALSLDDLKQFRQWGSKTPGHPERGHAPGVEVSTGPLGQGLANAVGMAIAERQLAATVNRDGQAPIDHHTWAIVSDGDLMEGVAAEAASLAGHLALGKLTCLYDDNRVTLAAGTDIAFSEDRAARFRAYGWHTVTVGDGNDVDAIDAAIAQARAETTRPSLLLVRTHLGYGSPEQDSFKAHGSPSASRTCAPPSARSAGRRRRRSCCPRTACAAIAPRWRAAPRRSWPGTRRSPRMPPRIPTSPPPSMRGCTTRCRPAGTATSRCSPPTPRGRPRARPRARS